MRVVALILAASIAVSGAHAAANVASSESKQAKRDKKDRVVCRTMMVTGTRFDRRVCRTVGEWEERAELEAEKWREQLSRPLSPEDLKALPSRTCPVGC